MIMQLFTNILISATRGLKKNLVEVVVPPGIFCIKGAKICVYGESR